MPPKPKRQSLTSALQAASGKPDTKQTPEPTQITAQPEAKPASQTRPSRQGKKFIGGYFSPEVSLQLKIMAAKQDRSQEDLFREALNMLFDRHGENPIA